MKSCIQRVAFFAFLAWFHAASAQESRQVRVTAESVNLRTAPRMESEVVGQVAKDDVLDVLRIDGNWLEVVPPTNVDLWVYGDLVQTGEVAVSKLVVRSGPGISYATVGRLEKGQKLDVRGSHGDWLKVTPPRGSAVWISRQFVEDFVRPSPAAQAAATPAAPTGAVASAVAGPEEAVHAFRGRAGERSEVPPENRLVRTREQGRWVEVRGVVRRAGWVWRRPTPYCIVGQEISAGAATQEQSFYVWANDAEVAPLAGRRIGIYGREYWMQGIRLPVIVPQRYFTTP
jgi:hypothetical protein